MAAKTVNEQRARLETEAVQFWPWHVPTWGKMAQERQFDRLLEREENQSKIRTYDKHQLINTRNNSAIYRKFRGEINPRK